MADSSKIRIRVGQVEIEYEGAHSYLSTDLPKLIESLVELGGRNGGGDTDKEDDPQKPKPKTPKGTITGTVAALAAKLDVESGPDLAVAAAAQLTLVENKESFKRQELLKAMKSASSYYKTTYSGNFTAMLKRLLTGDQLSVRADSRRSLSCRAL